MLSSDQITVFTQQQNTLQLKGQQKLITDHLLTQAL